MVERGHAPKYVPRAGPILSVRACAKMWQRSYRSTMKLIKRMIAADTSAEMPLERHWWLYEVVGNRRCIRMNVLKLRAAHPALFAANWVSREEYESLGERIARLEHELLVLKRGRKFAAKTRTNGTLADIPPDDRFPR